MRAILKSVSLILGENYNIGRGRDKKRALAFDREAVDKAGKVFDVVAEIKILEGQEDVAPEESEVSEMWDEWTAGTNGQMDKFTFRQNNESKDITEDQTVKDS